MKFTNSCPDPSRYNSLSEVIPVYILKYKSTLSILMWLGLALSIVLHPFLLVEEYNISRLFKIKGLAVHVLMYY